MNKLMLRKIIVFSIAGLFSIQFCIGMQKEQVLSGLDVVEKDNFQQFKGKKIGLICNHTSIDKDGKHIVDLFHENVDVEAIFAPEHGFRGNAAAGAKIEDGKDSKTGISIYSLYGKTKKPTAEMLENIDVLVYDIQDVGVRFYTYISTLTYCMEAAAENQIKFIVLDRPNPIRGDIFEGGILDKEFKSFVGMHATPIRYGLTVGEFATYINEESMLENSLKADLEIVKIKNWTRNLWYDETGMKWIAPSPNMPNLLTAIVYPGMCLIEGTNLSEGRGTATPFLILGAPWLKNVSIAQEMNSLGCEGITFSAEDFTPINIKGKAHNPKFKDEVCKGIRLTVTDRNKYNPIESMILLLDLILKNHPDDFKWNEQWIDKLSGNSDLRNYCEKDELKTLFEKWQKECKKYSIQTQKYRLY